MAIHGPTARCAGHGTILASLGMLSCLAGVSGSGPVSGAGGSPPPVDGGGIPSDLRITPADVATGNPPDSSASSCLNLCKQQMACPGGETTLSGIVHAPTPARLGTADPLYNVLVYVPNAPVAAFTPGVACQRCERASGSPLVSALSGPDGKFKLRNVPVGSNIPLVIQVGRWRRQVVVPSVAACTDTALPDELTRLPRNQKEGDIPAIAVATGTFDPFDCTLRKIGIDEAEFTTSTGTGRVNLWPYGGHGVKGPPGPGGDMLMGSAASLNKYDLLILPCDDGSDKDPLQQTNLIDYTNKGGRVFLTDLSDSWLHDGKAFEGTAMWKAFQTTVGTDFTTNLDVSFPKGAAFSAWLSAVGAARPMAGQLPIHDPFGGGSRVDAAVPPAQRWIYTGAPKASVQNYTFNTPVGMPDDKQCGRVVFTQFHVADDGGGDPFDPGAPPFDDTFPGACNNKPMTPQEKALEFMLFDLSSCIQADTAPVEIP
jgi:hypothetical protein